MTRRNLSDVLRQEVKKDTPAEAQVSTASTSAKTSGARSKSSASASVDQSVQVTELKAALAQGADHEKDLQAQLKKLQTEVKSKQKQVETLEHQLAQVETLKTELAEAKEVILQLSEVNTQMSATLDELKKPQGQALRKAPLASVRTLSAPPLPFHSLQPSVTESTRKPKTLDVGWMD